MPREESWAINLREDKKKKKKEESTNSTSNRERKKKKDGSDRGGNKRVADLTKRGRKRVVFKRWSGIVGSGWDLVVEHGLW